MTPLYEGKAKRLWATENPDTLRMEFKNDATAFNGEKKASFENKGRFNNEISTLIYGMLEKAGVPTHFVRKIDDTNVEVKKVDILMVEVIVRNLSAGSYCKRTGDARKAACSPSRSSSFPTRATNSAIRSSTTTTSAKWGSPLRRTSPTCANPPSR